MNKIYLLSLASVIGLTAFSAGVSAQTAAKDTTLNRQVYLEREYTPTIKDASKVNTLPALHEPKKKQYDIKFENAIPSVQIDSYPIGDTGSGDINTSVDYNKHRGYFTFGAGMYTNLEGALGYRIVDGNSDQLDLFATHSFTNARIKYLVPDSRLDKIKAKDMENMIKLRYSHTFTPLTWYISGSFLNNQYNYYGSPYIFSSMAPSPPPSGSSLPNAGFGDPVLSKEMMEEKQSANILEIETGIQSKEEYDRLIYSGSIKYNRFTSKYGPEWNSYGTQANLLNAGVNLAFPFTSDLRVGVKGGILHQSVSDVDFALEGEEPFHSLTTFNANPYFNIEGSNYRISLGVNLAHALDFNDKTQVAPTANIFWNFEERSLFYATVDGGINNNSLVDIFKENKYINPARRVAISQTPYDVQAGVKSGVIDGFEFDIFGGYKYTKNEHLYIPNSMPTGANVSDALYANLGTGHFGGAIKTRLIPYTDLSLNATGYFYSVKDYATPGLSPSDKKAWGLPSLTFDFNADFSFIDNLTLTANYKFEGGRKTYLNDVSVKMDAINELNFKANYQIYDWLSVYGKANNILNQKYERYYGYTLQGINILGGVNLKF